MNGRSNHVARWVGCVEGASRVRQGCVKGVSRVCQGCVKVKGVNGRSKHVARWVGLRFSGSIVIS